MEKRNGSSVARGGSEAQSFSDHRLVVNSSGQQIPSQEDRNGAIPSQTQQAYHRAVTQGSGKMKFHRQISQISRSTDQSRRRKSLQPSMSTPDSTPIQYDHGAKKHRREHRSSKRLMKDQPSGVSLPKHCRRQGSTSSSKDREKVISFTMKKNKTTPPIIIQSTGQLKSAKALQSKHKQLTERSNSIRDPAIDGSKPFPNNRAKESNFLIPPVRQTTLQRSKVRKNKQLSNVEQAALKDLSVFNNILDCSSNDSLKDSSSSQNEQNKKKYVRRRPPPSKKSSTLRKPSITLEKRSSTLRKPSITLEPDESDSFKSSNLSSESEKYSKRQKSMKEETKTVERKFNETYLNFTQKGGSGKDMLSLSMNSMSQGASAAMVDPKELIRYGTKNLDSGSKNKSSDRHGTFEKGAKTKERQKMDKRVKSFHDDINNFQVLTTNQLKNRVSGPSGPSSARVPRKDPPEQQTNKASKMQEGMPRIIIGEFGSSANEASTPQLPSFNLTRDYPLKLQKSIKKSSAGGQGNFGFTKSRTIGLDGVKKIGGRPEKVPSNIRKEISEGQNPFSKPSLQKMLSMEQMKDKQYKRQKSHANRIEMSKSMTIDVDPDSQRIYEEDNSQRNLLDHQYGTTAQGYSKESVANGVLDDGTQTTIDAHNLFSERKIHLEQGSQMEQSNAFSNQAEDQNEEKSSSHSEFRNREDDQDKADQGSSSGEEDDQQVQDSLSIPHPNPADGQIEISHFDQNRREVHQAMLFYPTDTMKLYWDIISSVCLVAACFMTPMTLAFEQFDKYGEETSVFIFKDYWTTIESIIDIGFFIEIIVCFNTSYYDQKTNEYVKNRCKIAKAYLRGWFWVDLVAILPRLFRIMNSDSSSLTEFLSFLKIARIGRLIKLLRLLKMAKTFKEKEKMQKTMQTKMRLNVAKERLFIFSIFAILFVHTISCLWIFLAAYNMDSDDPELSNWIDAFAFDITEVGSMYTIGLYWTITTITTVGYGDISATNTSERIVASIIMIIGVIAFSFAIGSLSSIIQNVDSKQAAYRQKLNVLKELRSTYGIDDSLYMELNAFINFQSLQRHQERDKFISDLPDRLRYRISELLYAEYKKKIYFFQTVQDNSNFIAWLSPNLKPLEVIQGALIQVEQEKLTHISFIKEGEAEYVIQRYNNQPYLICSEGDHFGVMDIVFRLREHRHERNMRRERHAQRDQHASSSSESSEEEEFAMISKKIKCKFTIRARKTCYLLQMERQALDKMKIEFPEVFNGMMAEELKILYQTLQRKAQMHSNWEQQMKRGEMNEEEEEEEEFDDEDECFQSSQELSSDSDQSNSEESSRSANQSQLKDFDGIQIVGIENGSPKNALDQLPQLDSGSTAASNLPLPMKNMAAKGRSRSQSIRVTRVMSEEDIQLAPVELKTLRDLRALKDIKEEKEEGSSEQKSSICSSRSLNSSKKSLKSLKTLKSKQMQGKQTFVVELLALNSEPPHQKTSDDGMLEVAKGEEKPRRKSFLKVNVTLKKESKETPPSGESYNHLDPTKIPIPRRKSTHSEKSNSKRSHGTISSHKTSSDKSLRRFSVESSPNVHKDFMKNSPSVKRSQSCSTKNGGNKSASERNDDAEIPKITLLTQSSRGSIKSNKLGNTLQLEKPKRPKPRKSFLHNTEGKRQHLMMLGGLDQEELIVMQDFAHDIRNTKMATKQAKHLTQKARPKRDSQRLFESAKRQESVTSNNLQQLISQNNFGAESQQQPSDQLVDIDRFIFEDQQAPSTTSPVRIGIMKGFASMRSISSPVNTFNLSPSPNKSGVISQKNDTNEGVSMQNLMQMQQKFYSMISDKIGKLQEDINGVKKDQESLIRKSRQIKTRMKKSSDKSTGKNRSEKILSTPKNDGIVVLPVLPLAQIPRQIMVDSVLANNDSELRISVGQLSSAASNQKNKKDDQLSNNLITDKFYDSNSDRNQNMIEEGKIKD